MRAGGEEAKVDDDDMMTIEEKFTIFGIYST